LSDEALALPVGPIGILVFDCWDCDHFAVITLAAQPAEKRAFEQTGVETIGLSAPVLARYCDARCVLSSAASFFSGWRSMPGTMPSTSQLDRLISITAISVPSGMRGLGDPLKSFNFCKGRSIDSHQRRWNAISSPPPHARRQVTFCAR